MKLIEGGIYNVGTTEDKTALCIMIEEKLDVWLLYCMPYEIEGKQDKIVKEIEDAINTDFVSPHCFSLLPLYDVEKCIYGYLGQIPDWMLTWFKEYNNIKQIFNKANT